jgi:uncharacterized protein YggE
MTRRTTALVAGAVRAIGLLKDMKLSQRGPRSAARSSDNGAGRKKIAPKLAFMPVPVVRGGCNCEKVLPPWANAQALLILALTALALIGGVAAITSIETTPVIACAGAC